MNILRANVTIMVTDMDKSIEFYSEVLSMPLKNRYGDHWAEIEGPGFAIGLHPSSQQINSDLNIQIGLAVEDFDNAVEELKAKGVQTTINKDEQIELAHFRDPDGNHLYFVNDVNS